MLGTLRMPRRGPHRHLGVDEQLLPVPAGFLWGAATADQQVERQQPSDWTAFEERARRQGHGIAGLEQGGGWLSHKADFDRHFADDVARAADMGHRAHRFSMSWARLFPREDMSAPEPAALDFYGRVLDELARRALQPFVTLFHFASPAWLWHPSGPDGKRGVERADAPARLAQLATCLVEAFGDRVRHWCTINEPVVLAYLGYLEGVFPPNEKRGGPFAADGVLAALLRMHEAAAGALRAAAARRAAPVQVGIAQHVRTFLPWRNHAPLDRVMAAVVERLFVLRFLDRAMPSCDYVGVNEYGRAYLETDLRRPLRYQLRHADPAEPGDEPSDLGWAPDERAFEERLVALARRYAKPIYVLENGTAEAATDDVRRQRQLVRHTQAMARAVRRGADVRGYFHWSLVDNFEWAEGFAPRFGLYAVDYPAGCARHARGSVEVYRRICRDGVVPPDLWARLGR
ncbi:MAG: glycoside hydrolase family 1 protein [Deltaproteobacteria bacterium]|nr:glycoside hydrolase family 1 protein [Deltaproteobacteria bacterium]